jgi:hypothetical protein
MKHHLSGLVMVILICAAARGEEVTFNFRGTIHELDGEFSYFTGHPFEITYSFDTTTDDVNPDDPESGNYTGAIRSGSLTIYTPNETLKWVVEPDGPENSIKAKNLDTADSYTAGASISGPAVGGEIPATFIVELIDSDANALGNDALPSSLEFLSFDRQRVAKFTFIGSRQLHYATWGIITSANMPVSYPDSGGDGFPGDRATGSR